MDRQRAVLVVGCLFSQYPGLMIPLLSNKEQEQSERNNVSTTTSKSLEFRMNSWEYLSISEAILITGGYDTEQSAELFLPWQNTTCELPPLPEIRFWHVQSGNTLCGGLWASTKRSCVQWSVKHGGWVTLALTLTEKRTWSSVWRVSQDNSLVIMGGRYGAVETSETVSRDGASTRSSFKMKYPTR